MAERLTVALRAVRNDLDVWAYVKDVLDQLLAGRTHYAALRPRRARRGSLGRVPSRAHPQLPYTRTSRPGQSSAPSPRPPPRRPSRRAPIHASAASRARPPGNQPASRASPSALRPMVLVRAHPEQVAVLARVRAGGHYPHGRHPPAFWRTPLATLASRALSDASAAAGTVTR
jgi:hypothetical protein